MNKISSKNKAEQTNSEEPETPEDLNPSNDRFNRN